MIKATAIVLLAAAALTAQVRLDTSSLRNDLFAGFAGDQEAVTRVLDASERLLAELPDHPQALVWHGAATLGRSQRVLQDNRDAGIAMFQRAIGEMDRAVELAPDDGEVRAIRGVLLAPLSRQFPPPFSERMLEKARSDYQRLFDMQRGALDTIGSHPLGELLQGLGDIYSRQGRPDEAERYYRMILTMLNDTVYSRRAAEWMQTRQPLPPAQTGCVGCHMGGRG
jgi:tetratricopeptide (TPR) repeat protein